MPYITDCKAPDIADLGETLLLRASSGLVLLGHEYPVSASRHLTGYLLVADKAIREYSDGRACLVSYSTSTNDIELFAEGLQHFETCIHSARRAFRFLDRVAADPMSPVIDRTIRKLNESWERRLTSLRNAIEHIDEEIAGETVLTPGMAHLLAINHDGNQLEISTHVLALGDLAMMMRSLHRAGCALLAALPHRNAG